MNIVDRLQELFPIHHRSGNILLLNADCMEVMKHIKENEFELSCVDPPYGIGMSGGNIGGSNAAISKDYRHFAGGDKSAPDLAYFQELKRVSKNQIIWGANHFCSIFGGSSPCWIVWDKDNSGNFADCELAYTSFKTAVRKFKYTWNGMLQGDMKNKEHRIHPTQKPVKLYQWLLTNYAKPEHKILDTHLGSASSAIAAHYYGSAEFVGVELDEDYCKAAVKRFNDETAQNSLF